jgi:hypothetical protein
MRQRKTMKMFQLKKKRQKEKRHRLMEKLQH